MEETIFNKILKSRNLTLKDAYLEVNQEIRLSRLSSFINQIAKPSSHELMILITHLHLSTDEVKELKELKLNTELILKKQQIREILNIIPSDLLPGKSFVTRCPSCGAKLYISKNPINNHLTVSCEKEGILIKE